MSLPSALAELPDRKNPTIYYLLILQIKRFFFLSKVLKIWGYRKGLTEDPLTRLKEKWNNKPNKKMFKLKEVDQDIVKNAIKKMHKKNY